MHDSANRELTRQQWLVLNCLADSSEPLEEVYADWADGEDLDPLQLLRDILVLHHAGYVALEQSPLPGLQSFERRSLSPMGTLDVVGDFRPEFDAFRRHRAYMEYRNGGGVPFGVYLEMTALGRKEWDRDEYSEYVG